MLCKYNLYKRHWHNDLTWASSELHVLAFVILTTCQPHFTPFKFSDCGAATLWRASSRVIVQHIILQLYQNLCLCRFFHRLCKLLHWLFNKDSEEIQWTRIRVFLVLILEESKIKFIFKLMMIFVSILIFETRCSNLAAWPVQSYFNVGFRQYCSYSFVSFEHKVCWIQKYVWGN